MQICMLHNAGLEGGTFYLIIKPELQHYIAYRTQIDAKNRKDQAK